MGKQVHKDVDFLVVIDDDDETYEHEFKSFEDAIAFAGVWSLGWDQPLAVEMIITSQAGLNAAAVKGLVTRVDQSKYSPIVASKPVTFRFEVKVTDKGVDP